MIMPAFFLFFYWLFRQISKFFLCIVAYRYSFFTIYKLIPVCYTVLIELISKTEIFKNSKNFTTFFIFANHILYL